MKTRRYAAVPCRERLAIDGLPNFRDLGGARTIDGRSVRYGRIYRSQGFEAATPRAVEALTALNIRLICDLRSEPERNRAPTRWPCSADTAQLHFDVRTDARAGRGVVRSAILEQPNAQGAFRGMIDSYESMPDAFASVLPALFGQLLDGQRLPALIHCHAGKDRTGFVCAMILCALDVPLERVFDDYLRTGQLLNAWLLSAELVELFEQVAGVSFADEVLRPVAEVRAEYLDAALTRIARDYGCIDRYLESAAGLDRARRRSLQALLLEEPLATAHAETDSFGA